jgi:D-lyxose ketol-isomerase
MTDISRRTVLKSTGIGMAALGIGAADSLAGCGACGAHAKKGAGVPKELQFDNKSFYRNGEFDVEKGKDAYIAVMKYHGYPMFGDVREKLWVSDYGIGELTRVGLSANMFVNNEAESKSDRFMLMDLFLLPNQMLPEHYHLATDKAVPKMEGWLVRNGLSYIIGEGDPTPGIKEMMPESQRASATVFHAEKTGPGGYVQLNRPTARHSQIGGPEGAVITEVANYHDNDGVRHTNPKLVFP